MKILAKGTMPNGTAIQIEEWNENYDFMAYGSTLATYPKSKASHKGAYSPKANETYRFEFDFNSERETREAFSGLTSGAKTLVDYKVSISRKEYADCI
jgi:hypothetical protein